MIEQLKNFLAFKAHAMSTLSNKGFAAFSKWISDSGATRHIPYLLLQFISLNLHSSKSIVAANCDFVPLPDIGLVDTPFVVSSDVYYIPCLTINLASVSKICDSGYDVKYYISDCSIYDRKTQEVVGTSSIGALGKLDAYDISDFSGCKLAKFSALPFSNSVSSSNALFDLVMVHIPYYSVLASSHNLTQSKLIKIDSFEEPTPVVLPIIQESIFEIPPVSDTPPQTTTTTEIPPVTIIEAASTVNQPLPRPPNHRLKLKCLFASFVASVHNLHEHVSYTEAVCDPLWQGVMTEKPTTLHQTHTWDLVHFPAGKRAIGSCWVYILKPNLIGPLKDIRLDLLLKVTLNSMAWIMKRHLLLLQK
ncbi:gag-pol polyprotein [Tanacetum coccineum]